MKNVVKKVWNFLKKSLRYGIFSYLCSPKNEGRYAQLSVS